MLQELKRYRSVLRQLTPNMYLLLAGASLVGLGTGIISTFFNIYLKQGGFGEAFLGKLNSLGTIGSLALAIPAGLLVNRLGGRASLVLSAGLIAAFSALQAGVLVPAALVALQIGLSASNMLYGATYNPEVMSNTDPAIRQAAFSMTFTAGTFTSVIASAAGGFLPHFFARLGASAFLSLRLTLAVGAALIFSSTAVFSRLRVRQAASPVMATDPPGTDAGEPEAAPSWRRYALRYVFVNVIIGFGAGMTIPYLNLYFASRFHADTVVIGALFAVSNVVLTLGALMAPWLTRRIGPLRTIALTATGSLVFLVIMAFATNIVVAAVAFWMRACLMMCSTPVTNQFCLELVPPSRRSVIHNVYQMAWTGSWAIATAIGGQLIEAGGFKIPMLVTAAVYGLYVVTFILAFRRHPIMRRPIPVTSPAQPAMVDQNIEP